MSSDQAERTDNEREQRLAEAEAYARTPEALRVAALIALPAPEDIVKDWHPVTAKTMSKFMPTSDPTLVKDRRVLERALRAIRDADGEPVRMNAAHLADYASEMAGTILAAIEASEEKPK